MTLKTSPRIFWVLTNIACGGVEVEYGVVTKTCPIYRRWKGLPWEEVKKDRWIREIREIKSEEENQSNLRRP